MRRRVGPAAAALAALLALAGCNPFSTSSGPLPGTPSPGLGTAQASVTTSGHGYQFRGWGTSLAWWAELAHTWSGPDQAAILNDLFVPPGPGAGPGSPGLGLTVLRYNLGASLSSARESPSCGPAKGAGATVPSLEPEPGQVSAGNDKYQEMVLQNSAGMITANGGTPVVEAFANSPPWWLLSRQHDPKRCTSGGAVTNSGPFGLGKHTTGAPDLPGFYDANYARYLLTVTHALEQYTHVNVNTLEPFNEPDSNWWSSATNQQEGSEIPPAQQATIIRDLLGDAPGPLGISAPDTNTPSQATAEFTAGGALAGLRGSLAQVNTHGYNDGDTPLPPGSPQWAQLRRAVGAQTDVSMSESGLGGDNAAAAVSLSQQIASALNGLQPQDWVYWQAVGSQPGNAAGWGLIAAPTKSGPVRLTSRYWAFDQYSRFIRPGATIFPTPRQDAVVVARNTDGRYVVVLTNPDVNPETFHVDLPVGGLSAATGYQTTGTAQQAASHRATVAGGVLTATVAGQSVTSYPLTPSATSRYLDDCQGNLDVKPTQYVLACADGDDYLTGMNWASWAATATGTGEQKEDTCQPNCADGTYQTYPVHVTLSGGAAIPGGGPGEYYTTMTLDYPDGRPPADVGASPGPGSSSWTIHLDYWPPGSG